MNDFFLLVNELPKSIKIDNIDYEINWGFRNLIAINILFENKIIDNKMKYIRALRLFYKQIPKNIEVAFEKMLEFNYWNTRDLNTNDDKKGQNNKKLFSFDEDGAVILSAFFSQYHIDLTTANLHWFVFKALFDNLNGTHNFTKIMEIRSIDLDDIADKQQREYYSERKKHVSLKDERAKIKKENDILHNLNNAQNSEDIEYWKSEYRQYIATQK